MHAPDDYDCPFCRLLVRGIETEHNRLDDVVWRDERTAALVSPRWWPANPGHVLVVPLEHVENLYAADKETLAALAETTQRVAIALRGAYGCAGTSTRQHNEPAAGQDVWHLHVHVFPRWAGDRLYERTAEARPARPDERAPYADRLRAALGELP